MKFYTVKEVAAQLGCSCDLVRSHIVSGRIKAINVGTKSTKEYRIGAESLQAFLESSRVVLKPNVKRERKRKPVLVRKSKWIRELV